MSLSLDKTQKMAVTAPLAPTIVVAAPGSGKTLVIIHRVLYLINELNVNPSNILLITFSKSSAMEMQARLKKHNVKVHVKTFHSLFFNIITRHHNYKASSVIPDNERIDILKKILLRQKMHFDCSNEEEVISTILTNISVFKSSLQSIDDFEPKDITKTDFKKIISNYDYYKQSRNMLDFDDMAYMCNEIFLEDKRILTAYSDLFQHILIDEFQDINTIQYSLVKTILKNHNHLYVVGDEDQSIYKFRGANPELIVNFEKDFNSCNRFILETNYRSKANIVAYSNKLISNNKNRLSKQVKAYNASNGDFYIMEYDNPVDECIHIAEKIKSLHKEGIPYGEISILYRMNIQSTMLISILGENTIPFTVKDNITNLFDHFIASDIIAYLELSQEINTRSNYIRIINKPPRYINKGVISSVSLINGNLIDNLFGNKDLSRQKLLNLKTLLRDVYRLRSMSAFDAVSYIRKVINYDEYLLNYAKYCKISSDSLFDIADEIMAAAENCTSIHHFLHYVEMYQSQFLDIIRKRIIQEKNAERQDLVTLSTFHSAKGLEFNNVFIISAIEGLTPYGEYEEDKSSEEERRLFYVAMTRAKAYLHISTVANRYDRKVKHSRFIKELLK